MQIKSTKILLIEDDQDDYILTRDLLAETEGRPIHLDWAQTYQDGLKKIQTDAYDIYLIDDRLGPHDGLQLIREAAQADSQAPVIILTGQEDREIDLAAMRAGAVDYLVKGHIDKWLLEKAIRYALERSRLQKEIRELSLHDALTGLYNRRELNRFLDYELGKSRRYNHPLSFVMIDIDHFKDVNDRFGHRAGDEALRKTAQALQSSARTCDLLFRYGGDEFAVVMPETSADKAGRGAERLRKAIEDKSVKLKVENDPIEKIKVTLSLGLAAFPGDADSSENLIEAADQALYEAKRGGRNRVARFLGKQAREDNENEH